MKKPLFFIAAAAFLLAPLAAASITVLSPNGGEPMAKGTVWQIKWAAAGVGGSVKIVLLKGDGSVFGVIAKNVPASPSAKDWTVGQTLDGEAPAGNYKIRVAAMDGSAKDASDGPFTIRETAPPVIRELPDYRRPVPLPFGKPRLAVTLINLVRNAGGYSIIFGYKNVGDGALPRRSELTVKPDYRVLIDGREVDKGDLFIPQSPPAAPGWEITTHTGGFIDFPVSMPRSWHIGTQITVHLNERNVLDMGTASKTSSLQPMALLVGYDLALPLQATVDWNANKARVMVTKVGSSPQLSKRIDLTCTVGYYHTNTVSGGPGQGTVTYPDGAYTQEVSRSIPSSGPFPWRLEIPLEPSPYYDLKFAVWPEYRDEFDERNNSLARVRFERPGTPPGPRVTAISFATVRDGDEQPKLRTMITIANETGVSRSGLRLVLKRLGSIAEVWPGIILAAGQKRLFSNFGSTKGPSPYNSTITFQALLYDGGGQLIDSRSDNHRGDY